jgi:anti-anti-sigma factor
MAAPQGSVRFRHQGQAVTFQVVGWGTMKQSLPVRRCAEQRLAQGACVLRMDLRHCTYLDSTFLGTLLTLQRSARRQGDKQLILVCPSPNCCRLLQQLGIDDAFTTETADEPDACDWADLPSERDDPCACTWNVVEAHRELASQGGVAERTFGPVVRQLSRECGPSGAP